MDGDWGNGVAVVVFAALAAWQVSRGSYVWDGLDAGVLLVNVILFTHAVWED